MKKTESGTSIRPNTGKRKLVDAVQYNLMAERLENLDGLIEQVGGIASFADRVRSLRNMGQDYQVIAALGSVYSRVSNVRREVIQEIDKIRKFYLTEVILSQMTEDALAPNVATGDVVSVFSNDEEINRELEHLNDEFGFDSIVNTVVEDLLAYGEYYLSTDVRPGEGLVDLRDDVEINSVMALTTFGKVDKYVKMSWDEVTVNKLSVVEPNEFVHFALTPTRVRVDMQREFGILYQRYKKKIPRFVRVGRSVLSGVIDKVKALDLLEQLTPALYLSMISNGSLVAINVPAAYTPEKAFALARDIENLLNKTVSINQQSKSLSVENVIAVAGRVKVIPNFGENFGKPSDLRLRPEAEIAKDLIQQTDDIRRIICESVGIPVEMIFSAGKMGGADKGRGDILKRYARYLRRLKSIQQAISAGLQQIAYIHLSNMRKGSMSDTGEKGEQLKLSFKPTDIEVDFRNHLIEVDNIDRLEFVDTTVECLEKIVEFVTGSVAPLGQSRVDTNELYNYLRDQLVVTGLPAELFGEEEAEEVGNQVKPQPKMFPVPGQTPSPGNGGDQGGGAPGGAPVAGSPGAAAPAAPVTAAGSHSRGGRRKIES